MAYERAHRHARHEADAAARRVRAEAARQVPPPPLDAETARFSESLMQIPLDLHPTPGDRPAGPSLVMRA